MVKYHISMQMSSGFCKVIKMDASIDVKKDSKNHSFYLWILKNLKMKASETGDFFN